MLSLEACRAALGPEAPLGEAELEEIRDRSERMAKLLISVFRESRVARPRSTRVDFANGGREHEHRLPGGKRPADLEEQS